MSSNTIKCRHLFICYTPLHVLLAKQVISLEKIGPFVVVYYHTDKDNAKSRYYYQQIASMAQKGFYVEKSNGLFHTVRVLFSLLFVLKRYLLKPPVIYTGNVKSLYSRFLIFGLRAKTLHTYDDGVGNICGEGYFYEGLQPGLPSRLLSSLGVAITYPSIYRLIRRHYTVYDLPNVMPNCEKVQLFNFNPSAALSKNDMSTSVLLTSTLSEYGFIDLEREKELYSAIIKKFDVQFIVPHPLEVNKKVEDINVTIIRSDKIAEELIMDLRKEFSHIRVIAWYSSALVHLVNIEGIENINVHVKVEPDMEQSRVFFESLGISTFYPVSDNQI
jgi:hypothetical protein